MRIIPFFISAILTVGLIIALSMQLGNTPPVGSLLSPGHGFWQNADAFNKSYNIDVNAAELRDKVSVYLDERLVPRVFAQNDHDLYFVQGWLHAKFRLWQMEFQAYAAAGRLCEILGEESNGNSILELHDRKFRRLGMLMAAESALKTTEKDAVAIGALNAYTDGVNSYLKTLTEASYPIEYKLLNYSPQPWTNLKTMLIFKYMSYDLTTDFNDFEATVLRNALGNDEYEKLFPLMVDSTKPIVPKSSEFLPTGNLPVMPSNVDLAGFKDSSELEFEWERPDPDNGSNNWAVSGTRTATGRPLLCNDPHLGLNLPSLWYEMQMHTPACNVYGVSLPGTPAVVIGFNDSIAWGLTNASRDVMDFYQVKFKDSTMEEYWYDSSWRKTEWRNETIHIKGKADFTDKIPVTVWGPVMYDANYPVSATDNKAYAVRWTAHDPSAELSVSMAVNRANNYNEFLAAISRHSNPGQNFVFASKQNEIALWEMGKFPAKWRQQGDFIMPGWSSSFAWQDFIPVADQIHQYNPAWGFVSSANQIPTDTIYPYYLGGNYDVYRGVIIKRELRNLDSNITVDNMKQMQNDNYNVFAEMAKPLLTKNINLNALTPAAKELYNQFDKWDLRAEANEAGMTIFNEWWSNLQDTVWRDEWTRLGTKISYPDESVLLENLLKDSAFKYVDNINTTQIETLPELVTASLNKVAGELTGKSTDWAGFKDTRVTHLLRIPAFSRLHLPIGGGNNIINCTKQTHGPSWRMIVSLTDETEAWGVYPGGQNGNPGSEFYDQFVDQWAAGKYYPLWIMKPGENNSDKIKWTLNFRKS